MRTPWILLTASLLLLSACGDNGSTTKIKPTPDTGVEEDADGQDADRDTDDEDVTGGCEACADDEVCVDNECLEQCPRQQDRCGNGEGDICCDVGEQCCAAQGACAPADAVCPEPCSDGSVCDVGSMCTTDAAGTLTCSTCEDGEVCGSLCCTGGTSCTEDGACALPDVAVKPSFADIELNFIEHEFDEDSCHLSCAGGAGVRTLLRLAPDFVNLGQGELRLGTPGEGTNWQEGVCEEQVLAGLVGWSVSAADSDEVLASGRIDINCLKSEGYTCADQGIAAGNEAGLEAPCPFADMTDLEPGEYAFTLTIDPDEMLPDADRSNNVLTRSLTIEPPCPEENICGGSCCEGECQDGQCLLPDITVDTVDLLNSLSIERQVFPEGDCAIVEQCVDGPGERRLLKFNTTTPNIGNADLFLGEPEGNDLFIFSACHQHYHFEGYAEYRLLAQDGEVVARGHKQAFCLIDLRPYASDAGPRRYNCSFQGISVGWSDVYSSGLDCQWVDITSVPPGEYELEIALNVNRTLPEIRYDNNVVTVPVTIEEDPNFCQPEPEICWDGLDQDCDGRIDEGCRGIEDNVSCDTAFEVDLSSGTNTIVGELTDASTATQTPSCGGAGGEGHFTFTLDSPQIVFVGTHGADVDTVLQVKSANCAGAEVACVDDTCGLTSAHFAGRLEAGTYHVIVKAKQAGATGQYRLKVQAAPCADASPIEGPGLYLGDTTGRENNTNPECALLSGPEEFHFMAACPGETNVHATTCGLVDFDTVIEWREGTCEAHARPGHCADDQQPVCPDNNRASGMETNLFTNDDLGSLWFLMVDGFDGASGPYQIGVSF